MKNVEILLTLPRVKNKKIPLLSFDYNGKETCGYICEKTAPVADASEKLSILSRTRLKLDAMTG
jgi:hypothetical protein